ncbi:MAG: hypothetical protein LC804_13790 [Acidobacteria bacterium]|nr:hypothetical protein [Acidobacteriota bacterium]
MARALIGSLTAKWNPEKYTDEYRENLMRVIDAKVKGRKPRLEEGGKGPHGADVVGLMSRLRKSLESTKTERKRKPAPSRKSSRRVA